jgi:NAD(P)H-nitrite reductase large subunit
MTCNCEEQNSFFKQAFVGAYSTLIMANTMHIGEFSEKALIEILEVAETHAHAMVQHYNSLVMDTFGNLKKSKIDIQEIKKRLESSKKEGES